MRAETRRPEWAICREADPCDSTGREDREGRALAATLAFSGEYVSDDGQVLIVKSVDGDGYSAARFRGFCDSCAMAGLTPPAGEPLADVRAAARFSAAHAHGDED